ncbi:TPA: hypothetical protein OMU21_004876 [Klebsiella aerogenes]|nr:hypothetical protein [Klebsiella aerogenes]
MQLQAGTGETLLGSAYGVQKNIISATLGFKSMKSHYATIKNIEAMGVLSKSQAESLIF